MLRTYRPVAGGAYFTALGAAVGYVLANAYLFLWFGGSPDRIDFLFLARSVAVLYQRAPLEFWTAAAIVAAFALTPLMVPLVATAGRRARASSSCDKRRGSPSSTERRTVAGGLALAVFGAAMGNVIASAYVTYRLGGSLERIDFLFLARNAVAMYERAPQEFWTAAGIIAGCVVVPLGLMASLTINEKLTTFGMTHWQSRGELKKNGFLMEPGHGFMLGKLGDPETREPFLVSKTEPHALMIAPTGAGKGVGFVTPNLLVFKGSIVALDVKGENFENTARHRLAMRDRVIRVAPLDWTGRTHHYNPLQRIYELKNPDQRMMALQKTAHLFLQSTESTEGLLQGGIDIFVACGLLAFERERPTIGEIYNLATEGGEKQKAYMKLATKVKYEPSRRMLTNLGSINDKTLTSYLSVLLTSGLNIWANPAIQRVTSRSDFSFSNIRRKPHAIYFEVPPDDIETVAPLARLFFSDLIASLHAKQPGPDEPGKVMIVLDEFDRLGKMPIVAKSIKTLRSFGGHLAIVSQSIPGIDEIYGENTRLSLQAGAGVKLYFTPSDARTVGELSASLGKTTRRVISKSRPLGMSPLRSRTMSERTEEAPLMSEDQVRRMDPDDVVLVLVGQMPIHARRIVFHEDPVLRAIYEAQTGELPWPPISKEAAPPPPEPDDPVVDTIEPTPPQPLSGPQAAASVTEPQSAVKLVASARRAAMGKARAIVQVQPLEAVVKADHAAAIRAALRRIEALRETPDAVLRTRRAGTKTTTLVVSSRRAKVGQARPAVFVQPVQGAGGPQDATSLRTANDQVLKVRDLVAGTPPASAA